MVADIALIRESQDKLVDNMNAKFIQLQKAVKDCGSTLAAHSGTLANHEEQIVTISDRLARVEDSLKVISSGNIGAVPSQESDCAALDVALEEFHERQMRKCNVVVFGVPESPDTDAHRRMANDESTLTGVFSKIVQNVDFTQIKVSRIGVRGQNRTRPIRVRMKSENDAHVVIANAAKVKNLREYGDVAVSLDRTPRQQAQFRNLRKELLSRQSAGEKDLKIRYVAGNPKIVKKLN